jgi:hypothetical protein
MTRPVVDVRLLEQGVQRTAHVPIPMFTGVWALG